MAQNNVRTGQPEDFMRIQDLFYLCLSKWYWFVISLGITLSVAILYVLVTPPVYMRSAALLIKDESKGQSLSGEVGGSFSDLGLFQANKMCIRDRAIPSRLLEHAAGRILKALKERFPQITEVELVLSKLNPPFGGDIHSASIILKESFLSV